MAKKTVHLHGAKAFKNTDANQNIIGDDKNNTVNGLGGKDIYDGGKGGGDKLIIHADWADAKITETKDGFKIKVGHDVMTVKNVEKFVFDDGTFTNKSHRDGWFVGGGVENDLNLLGIHAPGWFMKTEYRSAFYNAKTANELVDGTNALVGRDIKFNTWNQTISTSLVYRFNWSGPVVAKY